MPPPFGKPCAAALDGIVLEVFVPADKVGTHVVAGTPLFRIDDRHLKAQLAAAESKTGVGSLLNGGIGELLEHFKQNGQGDAAQSWINQGPNREVTPPAAP